MLRYARKILAIIGGSQSEQEYPIGIGIGTGTGTDVQMFKCASAFASAASVSVQMCLPWPDWVPVPSAVSDTDDKAAADAASVPINTIAEIITYDVTCKTRPQHSDECLLLLT